MGLALDVLEWRRRGRCGGTRAALCPTRLVRVRAKVRIRVGVRVRVGVEVEVGFRVRLAPRVLMVAVGPLAEATRRVVWVCPAGSEVSRPGEG